MSTFQLDEYRVKERQQYRTKKKMENQQSELSTPYRSVQAKGKAIRRSHAVWRDGRRKP